MTFNWHAPYLYILSKLGHQMLVVEPELAPGKYKHWEKEMRPIPENVRLLSQEQAKAELDKGEVDLLLAHNVKDLIFVNGYFMPKIMVYHNKLSTEIGLSQTPIDRNDYLGKIASLREGVREIYISEAKRADWGGQGEIVMPGIDMSEYGGYTGEEASILRVGNHFRERDLMLGFSISQHISEGFPCKTLGINPTIPNTELAKSFDELRDHFSRYRVYLNTTVEQYEDGYNLSMLEAMATGMPVISTANQSSPIKDGVNGFISNDITYLRQWTKVLLEDVSLAREMGNEARKTVESLFSQNAFLQKWDRIFHETVVDFLRDSGVSVDGKEVPFEDKKKKNVLMDYVSYPATTAYYMERALGKKHNVVTCGSSITPEVKKLWNLENLNWPINVQDIFRSCNDSIASVMKQLPENWKPDMYFWMETGLDSYPKDLDELNIPKVCYLIDTHLHLETHIETARKFDCVFIAQKEYIDRFKEAGISEVHWLPLGCDPEIHAKTEVEKTHDVVFVGSLTDPRRVSLLKEVEKQFDLSVERKFMDEMTETFCKGRVVFNNAIRNDLNMRVFEALCSGTLLVTDPAVGLEDFFEDGKHLSIYKDEADLLKKIQYYIDNPGQRERIAEEGRQEVLEKHTYECRTVSMMEVLDRALVRKELEVSVEPSEKKVDTVNNSQGDLDKIIPSDAEVVMVVGEGIAEIGKSIKSNRNIFIAGVEENPNLVDATKVEVDDVICGSASALEIPYDDHSFDCIIVLGALGRSANPKAFLEKIEKCLKPEGTLIIKFPNVQSIQAINYLIEGGSDPKSDSIFNNETHGFLTASDYRRLLKGSGFHVESMEEIVDSNYDSIATTDTTVLRFGRVVINDLSQEEIRRLFVEEYFVVAIPEEAHKKKDLETSAEAALEKEYSNLIQLSKDCEEAKQFDNAIYYYRQALKMKYSKAEVYCGMGNCYMKLQDMKNAEENFDLCLSLNEDYPSALMGMSILKLQQSNFYGSIQLLEKLIAKNPTHDRALCALGMVYEQMGQKKRAMEFYETSIRENIENAAAMTSLLNLSYELNQFDEIHASLLRYLEVHPANLNMRFGLAGILFKMDCWEEARESINQILIFEPKNENALKLLEQIETIIQPA
jgi:spore maturation protein CgeB/Flp pilus assembly protein TadD